MRHEKVESHRCMMPTATPIQASRACTALRDIGKGSSRLFFSPEHFAELGGVKSALPL